MIRGLRVFLYLLAGLSAALAASRAWQCAPLRRLPEHMVGLPDWVQIAFVHTDKYGAALFVVLPLVAIILVRALPE